MGLELRNPYAITGCNANRHLHGTRLPKPVAATPILVGASIPSTGRGLWSASLEAGAKSANSPGQIAGSREL